MSPSITLDNLAGMIKTGFDEVGVRFDSVEGRLTVLEHGQAETNGRLTSLEHGQAETNGRLTVLERGQEEIKLRLGNVAYRFELNDLDRRVKILEQKADVS
ncbi:MAG: hypothetical protein AAB817_00635 [Patescibacteria group bacterium]